MPKQNRDPEVESKEFISSLNTEVETLVRLQTRSQSKNDKVNSDMIQRPLKIVRKRLISMLDKSLYHQLQHNDKVVVAKANLIAGICTAAIHKGFSKDAMALYRECLLLFRELNIETMSMNDVLYNDASPEIYAIDPFLAEIVKDVPSKAEDIGHYSVFIAVTYYHISMLFDKLVPDQCGTAQTNLLQALRLMVYDRKNPLNSGKYCVETIQNLAQIARVQNNAKNYVLLERAKINLLIHCKDEHMRVLQTQIATIEKLLRYEHEIKSDTKEIFDFLRKERVKMLIVLINECYAKHKKVSPETKKVLLKLLRLADRILDYRRLDETYRVYLCMRKICDDTQINLDLEFMHIWIQFVKKFIAQIVECAPRLLPLRIEENESVGSNQNEYGRMIWKEQLLELCEFDVKVLENISRIPNGRIGADLYEEYVINAQALIAFNPQNDKNIVQRCRGYLNKALQSQDSRIVDIARNTLHSMNS